MSKQNRDEYQLFNQPLHTFPQYVLANQLAGDLKLVPDPQVEEQAQVLDRLSRQVKK